MYINVPRSIIKEIKETYPEGTRVKLIQMDDFQAPPIGTLGTVRIVDDTGTVHVNWDNGSSLGAVYGEDKIEKVEV